MRIYKIIFFALLLAFVNFINAQTFTWTGSSSSPNTSDWDDQTNWSIGDGSDGDDGYPNSTSHIVIIPNVSNDPVININGAVCGALTIQTSGLLTSNNGSNSLTATSINLQSGGQLAITNGEVTANGDFTHEGVLTMTAGILDINGDYTSSGNVTANISGGTIEAGADWDGTSGSGFDPSDGTVFFNRGSDQSISTHASNYFHNLTFGGGVKTNTVGSDLVINGNLLISSGTLDMAADANTLDVGGNFTLSGVSFIPYAGVHDIAGDWDDSGSDNAGFAPAAGKIILSGASSTITTKSDNKFFNLEIDKSSATATCNTNIEVDGTFKIASNTTYDLGQYTMNVDGATYIDGTLSISSGTYHTDGASDINGSLLISTTGIYDADASFAGTGSTITLSGAGFIKLGGSVLSLGGNLDATSGTLIYDGGGAQMVSPFTYYNLTIDQNGSKTVGSGNITVNGDLTVNQTGTTGLTIPDSRIVNVTGNTVIDGTLLIATSGTFNANGTSDINGTLTIDGTSKYDANDNFDATGGSITFGGAGFLEMSGTTTNLGSSFTEGSGTVEYDGTSDQTIFNTTYNHLIIDQNSTKSASANLDIDGNLTIDNSAVLSMSGSNYDLDLEGDFTVTSGIFTHGSGSHNIAGNWDDSGNNGGFTPSAGTVTLSGSGTTITTGSNNNFFNLTSVGDKTVQSELDINGDLTVSSGELAMGSNVAEVASSKTVDCDGTISLSTGVFTANGPSDFTNGTLSISSTGTYDANGTFTAASGNVTFTGAGFLEMSGTTTNLGSSFTEGSGTVEYDGTSDQTIFNTTYNHLIIDQNSVKSASANLDVDGNLTIDNSATLDMSASNYNLTLDGNYTLTSGTFTSRTGTVTFNGAGAQSLTPGSSSFYNLSTSTDNTDLTLQGDITVANDLTIAGNTTLDVGSNRAITVGGNFTNSGTFTDQAGTVTFNGTGTLTSGSSELYNVTTSGTGTVTLGDALTIANDLTIGANTTLDAGSNYSIGVKGNWSNSGTFTPSTGTVTFNGSGAQTISGTNTFYDLTINNAHASSKVSANGSTLTVQDDLLVSDGIFESASDYVDVTISVGATLELTGNITVSGDWSNSGTFTPSTNTVTFDGGVAQSLTSGGSSFYDLTTATASTDVTIQDALVVSNDLTIAVSTTLDAGSDQAISVGGNWSNSGTFTSASGTVTFNGSGAQTVTTGGVGTGNDFNNVTITNTGTLADGSDVETSGAIKVNGTLDITDGQFMPAVNSDFVNVTLSSSNGKLKQAGVGTITVSGTWNNSGGSSASFDGNYGTVSFDGGVVQTLTSGGISFNFLNTATASTDLTIQDALIVNKAITIAANTTLDAGSNQAISVGGNWNNSGIFTSASGTVTFNGSLNQTITTGGVGTGNDFYNLTIDNEGFPGNPAGISVVTSGEIKVTGTLDVFDGMFVPATSSEFLDVTISTEGHLQAASSSSITVSGNWSDASGTFIPNGGTVTMDGTSKTIATGAGNEFNNLTISGSLSTSTANDVEVEGTLTVSGSLTVSPGDELTLEDATVSGTLTVDADGSNDATLDFSEADNPVFGITGTLRLDGEDASNRAIVKGDGDSRIDFDITGSGVLNADYFTFQYPNTDGLNITGSGTQVLSYGAFDYPANSGTLLNISAATDLPDELTGFSFGNTGSASSPKNVTADGTTDLVTFTSYSGALASDASTAETNETDASNKVYWFNNIWYSSGNQTPTDNTKWWSTNGGSGLNPTNFTNASYKFIVQSGNTYTATGDWTVAGEVEVDGALVTGGNTITMAGKTDIDGTLTISNGGVYDANGEFDATGGTIDQDGSSALRMAGTVTSLGSSLDNAAGTVEYDGGVQQVLEDDYWNLVIDQSGNKTAQGAINVANDMTISNSATYLTGGNTTDVNGATVISATLDINAVGGIFQADGSFTAASGIINFSDNGTLKLENSPTSLGTLDNTNGKVTYKGGAINVLADNYYNLLIKNAGTKTALGTVNVAGDLTVGGTSGCEYALGTTTTTVTGTSLINGDLSISTGTYNALGATDINGTLTITNTGVYDADNTFTAATGAVTFSGAGFLRCNNTVTDLGTFTEGTGTVQYDGGVQNVLANDYYNLIIDQSGNKTAQGAVNVANDLTISNSASFLTSTHTIDVSGSTTVSATLEIGNALYNSRGGFSATGNISFSHSGGKLRFYTVSPTSLGTLDNTLGTVVYMSGATDVLSDDYYTLTIDDGGTAKTLQGDANIAGNLNIKSGDELNIGSNTITVTGNSDIDGTLDFNSGGIFDANSTFDATGGTVQFTGSGGTLKLGGATVTSLGNTLTEGTGTIEYDYAGNQTVISETYYNLEIDQSGTKESQGNLTIKNNLTITAGSLDIGTNSNNLTIGGNFANSGAFTTSGETVTFDGSTENTSSLINDATVDLIINKSGTGGITFGGNSSFDNVTITDGYLDIGAYTFTAGNTISIASDGTLKIPINGTFNADGQLTTSGSIDFTGSGSQGDLICSSTSANTFGTLDNTAGTVTFDGSTGAQAIPVETFFNLKNSNTNGLTMSGNATVNGDLNLNAAADITTGANTLTIGPSGSITNAADDRHINVDNASGFLAKSTNSTSQFSFPVGNGTILRPIRLTPSSTSAEIYTVRYDDNRYSNGSVTSAFSNTGGHISGYDNEDVAPNAASSGYYYDISRTNSVNAVLYIEWTDEDQYGTGGNVLSANVTGITFGYYNGTAWDVISSSPSGSISNGNVTSNAFDFAGQYVTLGSLDGENNLPIDLVSFEGECIDNQTNLEFVVASQVNNEYFTIERSKNLLSWEKLGDIVGGGTNNEEITYSFKDNSPNSGDNYYRLSQTDMDGTTESFSPIAVTCESKVEDYHIYPNPTTNRIAVEFELEFYQGDDIELVIRDFKGSIVKSNSIDLNRGYNYFEVDLNDIPNGIYTIGYLGTKNHIPLRRVIKM